jgi:hypothetical protein
LTTPSLPATHSSAIPSLTTLWVSALLHLKKTKKLEGAIQKSKSSEQKQKDIARLFETHGHKLITKGSFYSFDDLRKAVAGEPVLEKALAAALKMAMPGILERKDYSRFLFNVEKAQQGQTYKEALDGGLMTTVGERFLNEGYPAYYQKLKQFRPDDPSARQKFKDLDNSFEIMAVPQNKILNFPNNLTLMFETNAGPVIGRAFCQLGPIGGMTPRALVDYYAEHGKPGQAETLKRVLRERMELRAGRMRTVVVEGKEMQAPSLEVPAIQFALEALEH